MSYKKNLDKYRFFLCGAAKEGKETKLYAKQGSKLYEANEFLAYVDDIQQENVNDMATLRLRFADGEVVDTMAFIDTTIVIGSIVSVVGYFTDNQYGKQFHCKGGINAVLTRPRDLDYLSIARIYRMGLVTSLSKVKVSAPEEESEKFLPVADSGFYYKVLENPKLDSQMEMVKNILSMKDRKSYQTINIAQCSADEDEEEFYEDGEEETSAEQVKQ